MPDSAASTLSIAEIIEVTTSSFVARCREVGDNPPRLFDPPDFGSFVKVLPFSSRDKATSVPEAHIKDSEEIDPFESMGKSINPNSKLVSDTVFAVVCWAKMSALDAGRRPTPHGLTYDQLLSEQPQIFVLLTTDFSALAIAYTDSSGNLRRHLPPRPPRIYSEVKSCSDSEIVALTSDLRFLQSILKQGSIAGSDAPVEELAAAVLRQGLQVRGDDSRYLQESGISLAAMLGADYDRLQAIMRSVIG